LAAAKQKPKSLSITHLQAQERRKAGLRLKLTGQPFQILAILVEPGTVVTRGELQKRLWPDTFVCVDHNLNTAINKIREALGHSSEIPRFVEPQPRRGCRFLAQSGLSVHFAAPTASAQAACLRPLGTLVYPATLYGM